MKTYLNIADRHTGRITTPALLPTLLIASAITAVAPAHAKSIQPSSADYSFTIKKGITSQGRATRTLKKSGDTWEYSAKAHALGKSATANQYSRFKLVGNSVKPLNASTSYKVFGRGGTHKIRFHHNSATSSYKGKSTTLAMPTQAYDDLSLEAQIRQDLLNGQFANNYKIVKKEKIITARFKKTGNAKVTVPAGTFDTVRIDKVHGDKQRRTTFWLAPSLDYLPVKVVQNTDDADMLLELTKIN